MNDFLTAPGPDQMSRSPDRCVPVSANADRGLYRENVGSSSCLGLGLGRQEQGICEIHAYCILAYQHLDIVYLVSHGQPSKPR